MLGNQWYLGETQDAEEAAGQGSDADILCNLTFVSPAAPQRRISHPLLGLSFLSICHHSLEALASTPLLLELELLLLGSLGGLPVVRCEELLHRRGFIYKDLLSSSKLSL